MYSKSPNKIWKSEKTVNKIKCEKNMLEHKEHSNSPWDAFN